MVEKFENANKLIYNTDFKNNCITQAYELKWVLKAENLNGNVTYLSAFKVNILKCAALCAGGLSQPAWLPCPPASWGTSVVTDL